MREWQRVLVRVLNDDEAPVHYAAVLEPMRASESLRSLDVPDKEGDYVREYILHPLHPRLLACTLRTCCSFCLFSRTVMNFFPIENSPAMMHVSYQSGPLGQRGSSCVPALVLQLVMLIIEKKSFAPGYYIRHAAYSTSMCVLVVSSVCIFIPAPVPSGDSETRRY